MVKIACGGSYEGRLMVGEGLKSRREGRKAEELLEKGQKDTQLDEQIEQRKGTM